MYQQDDRDESGLEDNVDETAAHYIGEKNSITSSSKVVIRTIQNKSTSTYPPKKHGGGIMCTKSDRCKILLGIIKHKSGTSTSSAVLALEQPEILS